MLKHDSDMDTHPRPSAKNEPGEYEKFETALKKVLSVPRSRIKSKLIIEKRKRASARASSNKG
jgi:hypothetical protein